MSHLLIAASRRSAPASSCSSGVLLGLLRRSGGRVAEVERRLDALAADLGGAVERAEEEGRRSRLLGDISGTIDLDDVLTRALEAITAVPGVDAALIRVDGEIGPIIAAHGLADEEAARQSAAVPPGQRDLRAVELTYRYAEGAGDDVAPRRACAAARRRERPDRDAPRPDEDSRTTVRGRRAAAARGDRAPHGAGDRERAPLSGSPSARRPRRPDGAAQPPLLPRDARPRDACARTATRASSRSSSSTSTTSRK